MTVETVHSGDRETPPTHSSAQYHEPTLHLLDNKYINVYNIYSYAYKYIYILYIIFIYIYTLRHVRPCAPSNARCEGPRRSCARRAAKMSSPDSTLGFLASLSLGGNTIYLAGFLGTRVLFLCSGGVGIEYSLPTNNLSIIHASTQVIYNLFFGLR